MTGEKTKLTDAVMGGDMEFVNGADRQVVGVHYLSQDFVSKIRVSRQGVRKLVKPVE